MKAASRARQLCETAAAALQQQQQLCTSCLWMVRVSIQMLKKQQHCSNSSSICSNLSEQLGNAKSFVFLAKAKTFVFWQRPRALRFWQRPILPARLKSFLSSALYFWQRPTYKLCKGAILLVVFDFVLQSIEVCCCMGVCANKQKHAQAQA
jgi:hypothetical protein